ncbi:hypothetical protein [Halobacterium salinarum]|uniref:hypothetical protein n=1 Tax=Halobacterium salinarum TaxID=2242 RepID=UPI002554234D|nr:hypothetical protein [Halobacterium salinarum]MDL0145976.1 hypothetical protein [Halobacterium salinarum]
MFGFNSGKSGDGESMILPHQVTQMYIERKVETTNQRIDDLNTRFDWSVYKLPEKPSLGQLRGVDDELCSLYNKVTHNRSTGDTERNMIIEARQAVQDLLEFYLVFDRITKPVDTKVEEDENGGVANVST